MYVFVCACVCMYVFVCACGVYAFVRVLFKKTYIGILSNFKTSRSVHIYYTNITNPMT